MFFHPNRETAQLHRTLPLFLILVLALALTACSGGGGGEPEDVAGNWSMRVEFTEASDTLREIIGEVVTGTLFIEQDERSIQVADGSGLVAYGTVDGNQVHFTQVYSESQISVRQQYDLVVSADGNQMPGSLNVTVSASGTSGWARGVVSASRNQPSAPEGGGGSFLAVNTHPEASSIVFLRLEVEGCGRPVPLGLLRPGEALEVALPQMPCTVFLVEARGEQPEGALDEGNAGTIVLYRSPEPDEWTPGGLARVIDSITTR